jgi:predicted nucleotidyltransferase
VHDLALQVSKLDHVEAVILGGSISTGIIDGRSDIDLYVYARQAIEVALRERILKPRAARLELQRTACDLENCVADHLKSARERLATWLKAQGWR